MLFLHVISGPLALLIDIISLGTDNCLGLGCCFRLFKIFTTPLVKGVIVGTFKVLPLLITPFAGIIALIFILAMWSLNVLSNIEDYWADVDSAVYTFI